MRLLKFIFVLFILSVGLCACDAVVQDEPSPPEIIETKNTAPEELGELVAKGMRGDLYSASENGSRMYWKEWTVTEKPAVLIEDVLMAEKIFMREFPQLLDERARQVIAYGKIVDAMDNISEYCFFDIDGNGEQELIIHDSGDAGVTNKYYFYAFDGAKVVWSDFCSANHRGLRSYGGKLVIVGGQASANWADEVYVQNGKIQTRNLYTVYAKDGKTDPMFYEWQNKLKEIEVYYSCHKDEYREDGRLYLLEQFYKAVFK